jgi:hypothetical protein
VRFASVERTRAGAVARLDLGIAARPLQTRSSMSASTAEFPAPLPESTPWLGEDRLGHAGDRIAGGAAVVATAFTIAVAIYATWALPVLWIIRAVSPLP